MNIIINETNLKNDEIENFSTKVRAILLDEGHILVANYGNVILLPGGSVDNNETVEQALIRELSEEIGVQYKYSDFDFLATISFYQNNYPNRNGNVSNRLVQTHYFVGPFKGIQKQTLTEKERKDNFNLELIPIIELENKILNNQTDNPRNIFFQQELMRILDFYKTKNYHSQSIKTKIKK